MTIKHLNYLLIGAAALLLCWLVFYYATRPSEASITGMIRREIPMGASVSTVTSFLDRHQIQHDSTLDNYPGTPKYLRNTLNAYINPNVRILWITGALSITFWFSPDDRLTKYSVSEDWSGLP